MLDYIEHSNSSDYLKPIPSSSLINADSNNKSSKKHKIGHLGLLAQLCNKYCSEFDSVINQNSFKANSAFSNIMKSKRLNMITDEVSSSKRVFLNLKKGKKLSKKIKLKKLRLELEDNKSINEEKKARKRIKSLPGINAASEESQMNQSKRFRVSSNSCNERETQITFPENSRFGILSNNEAIIEYNPVHKSSPHGTIFNCSGLCSPNRNSNPDFSCNWLLNNGMCNQMFRTNDELIEHTKFHMTSTILDNMDYYYRIKMFVELQQVNRS